MRYKFTYKDDFLIIKLFGKASANERLVTKGALVQNLQKLNCKVIIDMSALEEKGGAYILGILNMIKKEVQIMGGTVKLCALNPRLNRYFQENRFDEIFEIKTSIEQAKRSFRRETGEGEN